MPNRVQLSRGRGWRMPPDTVKVSRPGRYGNPFPVGAEGPQGMIAPDQESAVGLFRQMMFDGKLRAATGYPSDEDIRADLRGKNLACWCKIGTPCHVDVLIEIANAPTI